MISEGSSDWSNDAENLAFITGINNILKYIKNLTVQKPLTGSVQRTSDTCLSGEAYILWSIFKCFNVYKLLLNYFLFFVLDSFFLTTFRGGCF